MATETDTLPLIRTKLYRPRITGDLVPRPRLLERLEQRRDRPLTLVVAPAGYGKTTLVTSWLATCDYPSAWLSLDEDDNDLVVFLSYFSAAVQTIFPGAVGKTSALLNVAKMPPLDVLARSLINELDQIEQSFTLVLDDYHAIQNMEVHHLLAELFRYPPRALHLVLASRNDPPLPITRLRARGQATEIRTHELRFTEAETAMFLKQFGMPADDRTVQALLERVEGWVTGMRLAVLSSRHRGSVDLAPAQVERGISYVTEYLLTEVLEGQPPAIQDYLLRTSVLERFCAPLCEAVCLSSTQVASSREAETAVKAGVCELGGQAYLDWLEASNLFVVALDEKHEWYRYHHLFQQLLRNQLQRRCGPDEIAAIHTRASAWYAQNDLIGEALSHALNAGDDLGAAQLVERNSRLRLNEDQWHVLEKWMAKLPEAIIQQRPQLLLAKAWVSYYHFALWAIPPLLEALETMLDDDVASQPSWGEVDFFWGHHWYWQGQSSRSLDLLGRALERIPEAHHAARGEAELWWGLASQYSGQRTEAVQRLNSILHGKQPPPPVRQIKLLGALVFVHMLSGELTEVAQATPQIRELAIRSQNAYITAWISYLQAYVAYFQNELGQAAHHFAQAVEGRYVLYTRAAIDSLAGLTLTYQAMQQPDKASATMNLLLEYAQQTRDPPSVAIAHSCRARLSLLQGDLVSAVRWLKTTDLPTDAGVMFYWLEIPHVTKCRVLIAEGSAASLQEAEGYLHTYEQVKEARHNTRQLIDILLLQAVAYQKQEQTDRALAALERAVTLALPGGWIRPFVELGPTMAGLLVRLSQQGVAPQYIVQILAAFPAKDDADAGIQRRTKPQAPSPVASTLTRHPLSSPAGDATGGLVEPLTKRELEVLELMAQRFTNKEIAAQLVISVGTVKQHAYNINQKLNVRGRRQAVAKAISLGILSSS
jgi:LuxR family maltose regulon positive regulatory protein